MSQHSGRQFRLAMSTQQRLYEWQQGRCYLCGGKMDPFGPMPGIPPFSATLRSHDHIYPWRLGGKTVLGNLAYACRLCDSSKRDRKPVACERLFGALAAEALLFPHHYDNLDQTYRHIAHALRTRDVPAPRHQHYPRARLPGAAGRPAVGV